MAQVSGAAKPYCLDVTTGAGLQWSSVRRLGGQLGDGRGILLGEQLLADGTTMDWHLKVLA
ncbi:hypothetical protein ACVXG9_01710 [Escherichia coli]